ncbi:amino acid permease-domain-containing protein [Fusarium redolens]|uniref:Amino acid permease-domain-containing protein n=1 Tax=Fusarium redolens TaxID=48865 RepID=A0A9P9G883_FUSRE|nr:amino acid permease-domain-containing protein [Fusarium redolens]KAH7234844.1 amino acid permease-domain-containing protein [Fusarium redolens]
MDPSSLNPETSKKGGDVERVGSIDIGGVSVTKSDIPELDGDALTAAILDSVNHRRSNPRHIQLTAFAGSIGAALFVAISSGVLSGPLCLLLAFMFWVTVVFSVAQCQMKIVTLFPLDGSFIHLAGRMVDPALGVAIRWNHLTSYVIFEATIINTLVEYWGYDESPATLIPMSLVFYLAINVWRADLFGEAEFWLALAKVILAAGLILYTIVVMLGGNPLNDRFGFRYWKDPGVWAGDDAGSRLKSFINAVNVAGFVMGDPEYISMIAGEARDPRRTVPRAFKTIIPRLMIFPHWWLPLRRCGADTYSGASPYVISMERLQIPVLPSIVTAVLITTIVSAGNAYTFNASRSLHALALEGQAPKFLRRLNNKGVPYLAVIVVMTLACLAFLALGSTSAKVLNWILKSVNWTVMAITWIRFNAAMKAQDIDRETFLPVRSRFQPYAGYWAFFCAFIFLCTATFIFNYGIIALAGSIGLGWKLFKKTRFHRASEVDLVSHLYFFGVLTEHYRHERETAPQNLKDKILASIF